MNYTIEGLQKLIQQISPEELQNANLSPQTISKWKLQAANEREFIKTQLMEDVFRMRNEKLLELYIQNCQLTLINLADRVTEYAKHFTPRSRHKELYQNILAVIESILTFVEQHFSRYFNLDARIPESYYRVEISQIKKKAENLDAALETLGIDKTLLQLLFQQAVAFIKDKKHTEITYRKLMYLKGLLNEISDLSKNTIPEKSNAEVINLMLYLNFNHVLFFNYYINNICNQIEGISSISDRIEKISFFMKQLNQLQYKPGVALFQEYPHIKEQIIGWLTEEIYFLEKKHQLNMAMALPKLEVDKCEPVFTSLSVPQLAFFMKLLVDVEVVNNRNQTELLKTITRGVRTHRNETISIDSLRNKYYSVDKSTTEAIKDKLFNMINQLKKYS